MNKPYQFIGYWGASASNNASILNNLVANNKSHKIEKFTNYALAYLGDFSRNSNSIEQGVSGIPNLADIWVKIDDKSLILGRGIFGRANLYWLEEKNVIWFASQFQLLLPLISQRKINLSALYGYTCFSYFPNPLTPVENIYSLPCATEYSWEFSPHHSPFKHTQRNLYQWQSFPKTITKEEQAIKQLQILLKNAVENQIQDLSNEPVGVLLSGGLDSSIIAALLVQLGVKVRAFTLDFGDYVISEIPYAEKVANYLKIPLIKVSITPKKVKQVLTETVRALDIPFGDGVTVPLYLLCQAASQETGIIFNGENGDQLFAGWTNKPLIAAGIYRNNRDDFTGKYLKTFHRLWRYEEKVFVPAVYGKLSLTQAQEWISPALNSKFSSCLMDRFRRATLLLKGAQNIQPRATNLAFSQGLWVRSPFCNLHLAEWTFQVSGELFLRGSCEKYILKKAVESWLPAEIVWREKRGMGVPLTQWCLGELWGTIGSWLNPNQLGDEGIFMPQLPLQIILGELSGHIRGRRIGEILWLLLIWQVWRSQFFQERIHWLSWDNPFLLPYWYWKFLARLQEY